MNIVIVHCGKGIYGGAERVIVELSNYLHSQHHKVMVVARDVPQDCYDDMVQGVICIKPETYYGLRATTQDAIGWADVVNVHNFPATLTTFPVRTRPTVWMCNEPAELFTNWKRKLIEATNRWWVRSSRMGVVVADKVNAERFEKIYKVKPKIIPYGVDYGFWSGGERVGKRDGTVLLQVGTISPYKNQLESVKALRELGERIPRPAILHLVGSISDREYFDIVMGFAKCYRLRVEHHSHQTREMVRDWYNYADVLLHPVMGQGGWLVPFEAICAGLPVIYTTDFPASSILQRIGMPISYPGKLDLVITYLMQNYTKFAGIGKEWIKENMTWERFGEEMVNAYKENIRK